MRPIADCRETAAVGRDARLELTFTRRGGRTILAHAYAEPPFRVGPTFPDGDGVHMILATVAPGIFGGDSLRQTVVVEPGARVRLTSQSALQIHPSAAGRPACLDGTFVVEGDGELRCEWDPLIPFAGARFDQRIRLELDASSRVFWSDATMAGREGRGERWAFAHLAHELVVRRTAALEYVERYHVAPETAPPGRPWVARDACYFGTVFASGWEADASHVADVHAEINCLDPRVSGAADRLHATFVLIRLLSSAGVPFREARARAARAAGFCLAARESRSEA